MHSSLKYLIVATFILLFSDLNAQSRKATASTLKPQKSASSPLLRKPKTFEELFGIESVDIQPLYPGGIEKFQQYVAKNVDYPSELENAAPGIYKVKVSFVIDTLGRPADFVKTLEPAECKTCADEIIRVLVKSPSWLPASQNGRKVRVHFTLPFSFPGPESEKKQ